jgi:hypothetical protein
VSWEALEALPVAPANAFAFSITARLDGRPGELVLNIGYLVPPIITGSTEDQVAQMNRVERAVVHPVARISFSRERALELQTLLNRFIQALPA